MEVAGVVLGAVPIIMLALENYKKATGIFDDTKRWLNTIQEIQDILVVQINTLRVTLWSLGIEWECQSGIPVAEIEMALKSRKPLQWENFLRFICRMDTTMKEMAKDLCLDADGPVST